MGSDVRWEESLDPAQAQLRNQIINRLNDFSGWDMPDYVPGATGLQQAGFDAARQLQTGGLPGYVQQGVRDLATGRPSYTYDPAESERFYQEGFVAPQMREFESNILPLLRQSMGAAGLENSGDMGQALARAGSDFQLGLSGVRAGLMRDDLNRAFTAGESAMARMPTGLQMGAQQAMLPVNLGLQVGGVQRGIEGELGMQGLQQNMASQWWGNPAMGFLNTALTPTRMPMQKGDNGSLFSGILGGAATGAAAGSVGGLPGMGLGALVGGTLGAFA